MLTAEIKSLLYSAVQYRVGENRKKWIGQYSVGEGSAG